MVPAEAAPPQIGATCLEARSYSDLRMGATCKHTLQWHFPEESLPRCLEKTGYSPKML